MRLSTVTLAIFLASTSAQASDKPIAFKAPTVEMKPKNANQELRLIKALADNLMNVKFDDQKAEKVKMIQRELLNLNLGEVKE